MEAMSEEKWTCEATQFERSENPKIQNIFKDFNFELFKNEKIK
jgi:hypothetical protein